MAATNPVAAETEDLLTCSVCLTEYDEDVRKPKFLPCSHTLCLECLKSIIKDSSVLCPLCRQVSPCQKGVASLPNNSYALHMIRSMNIPVVSTANLQNNDMVLMDRRWCFKCFNIAVPSCKTHPTISMGSSTLSEAVKLQELNKRYKVQVAIAIERRKQLSSHLKLVEQALQSIKEDIKDLKEMNRVQLEEMTSLTTEGVKKEETISSMTKKLKESMLKISQELLVLNEQELEQKTRISIQLRDQEGQFIPSGTFLEEGFTVEELQESTVGNEGALSVVSHIILTMAKENQSFSKRNNSKSWSRPNSRPASQRSLSPVLLGLRRRSSSTSTSSFLQP